MTERIIAQSVRDPMQLFQAKHEDMLHFCLRPSRSYAMRVVDNPLCPKRCHTVPVETPS